MQEFLTVLRFAVFALFAGALAAAVASWLVRTQRVSPFGGLGRGLKAFSDPVLKPVEARLFRSGGNPVHAGWWLVIGVAVLGVVGLALVEWLIRTALVFEWAAHGGPRAVLATVVNLAYRVLFFALFARVILSWFGVGRYNRWMRPAYWLTDWLVEPIRRVLPPFGMFDLSPLVALVVLWVLRVLLLSIL
ncbi:MAG: YggT family protein [Gemmatimonadales bacterium]